MKAVHSTKKFSDVASKSTIFEQTPTEPKKKKIFTKLLKFLKSFMLRLKFVMLPLTLEWTAFALATTTKILYSTSKNLCGNLADKGYKQTKNQQFIFLGFFFSIYLIMKKKVRPRLEAKLLGYTGHCFTSSPRESNLEDVRRKEVKRSQQMIQLILLI